MKVKYSSNIESLAYSVKCQTVECDEYFRVLPDNQMKVCYNCMSDKHFIREWPNIVCHFRKEKGHYVLDCPKTCLCDRRGSKEEECMCNA